MNEDPIVAEVRRVRDKLARQFNYDVHAILPTCGHATARKTRRIRSCRTRMNGPTQSPKRKSLMLREKPARKD